MSAGAYAVEARLSDDAGVFASAREEFVIERASVNRSGRVPLTVTPVPTELAGWPITVGVPFPRGALDSADNVRLLALGRRLAARVFSSDTNHTAPWKCATMRRATSMARRVLPLPPGPSSLTSRAFSPSSRPCRSASSRSRPANRVKVSGSSIVPAGVARSAGKLLLAWSPDASPQRR